MQGLVFEIRRFPISEFNFWSLAGIGMKSRTVTYLSLRIFERHVKLREKISLEPFLSISVQILKHGRF